MGATYKQLFKLYDLIQSGDIRSIKQFLENESIEINDILPCKGIGILHLAVGIDPVEKSKECTEIILKHGGNPNLCNEDGITPVHIAAIWGRLDNLKLLIGCGGEPSLRDLDGLSAFDYAVREQQWEVYDYLHNVEDQLDDSITSPCAYSLDLDRVLVTTDQMVAEYKPTDDNQTNNTIRKSDLVRDWCEKTSLVMNKLYPTIFSETYLLENESEPWNTTNLTIDISKEHKNNVNDTINSFKTCLTNDNVEISGIQRLDQTIDKTCMQTKQRYSVYENFSLPGSPKCITHKNYNTKTSLKKSKRNDLCPRMQNLTLNSSNSLLTDDASLDKAMAVVQNRTNEWLSSCSSDVGESKACNTRRSSASSGVSSNYSGGNIVIANVHEEYKYEDKEEGVVLIEKRLLLSPVVLPVDEADMTTPDQTILSVASSLPSTMDYDVITLRSELMKLGFTPGPIHESTKTLYLKKLQTLKKTPTIRILIKSIRSSDWLNDLNPYIELEKKARADFANPNKKWREGTTKTSFTYLLLDPRLTDNLPVKANKQNPHELWGTFINSIFYVGKGKRSRPYSHLYQALTLWKRDFKTSNDKKVQQILDIWLDKVGVICLHIFQNVIPAEAFTYEAAMIDVLGLQNLKNIKSGNYYGVTASWPLKERRMLGLYLLYKAMQIFLTEGERQLRPDDID
ncbi:Ankyrin repeat and LEM domain-containing protein 1 [Papilio xuthus]|uniref:Ankyrin repeat and LEM domain-containing protein 1 n=1 Tax=Papilio xuthus TaxID=66420 RepID=A0A194QE84_PAPXU|nr:Ankyrin repeat and LEM domain-containing protein 1 [Papilio xuthus]